MLPTTKSLVPHLESGHCQIWWGNPGLARPEHRSLLNPVERGRAAAYVKAVDRDRFTVGCALSRLVLGGLLGIPAASVPLTRECDSCGGPHGRPRVTGTGLHLSVSHSGSHVALAVTAAGPVGVDVERITPDSVDLAGSVLAADEHRLLAGLSGADRTAAFFQLWTRKEAALKAAGTGLRVAMTDVDVSVPERPVTVPGHPPITVIDLDVDDEHAAALGIGGLTKPSVLLLDATDLFTAAGQSTSAS